MLETAVKPTRTQARPITFSRQDILVGILLVFVMLIGGYFRFAGQNWDDFTHLHPDERFLTDVASSLNSTLHSTESNPIDQQTQLENCRQRYPNTNGAGGFFDAECSLWNPHNATPRSGLYVYGTLPLFMARGLGDLVVQATGNPTWSSYNGVHLVWRSLSALAEMTVIFVVFLIGVKLHDKWVGLLAAILYAAVVFSIQQAHFGTVDAMSNLFTVLTIYLAVRVQDDGGLLDYGLFGLAFAAALASRINLAPLAGLIILAAILRMFPALDGSVQGGERQRITQFHLIGLVLAGAVTVVGFRIMNPYAFMGPGFFGIVPNPRWLADIAQAQHLVSGAAEMPPNWQWASRTPYLFPFSNMVLWGMGIALGLAGWAGWLWSGWRLIRGQPGALKNLLLFVWVLVYFGWLGRNWVSTMRYFLPLYPVLTVLAAWLLVELVKRGQRAPVRRALAMILLAGVVGLTYLWAGMFTNIYRHQLTRVQASHWIWENVCGDFCMVVEGAPPETPLINIPIGNGYGNSSDDPLLSQASAHFGGQDFANTFIAPADGVIRSVRAPHIGSLEDDGTETTIRVAILEDPTYAVLGEATLTDIFDRDTHVLGNAYDIELDTPVEVTAGTRYLLQFQILSGATLVTAGEVVSQEGAWDDPIPYTVCTLPQGVTLADDPPPGLLTAENCNGRNAWTGLLNGYEMQMAWEDEPSKRDRILRALNASEYLTISSNRFYDSVNRIPIRWPMTNHYYDVLFSGQLGFELVEVFQETFELGPLKISDQYLPIYDAPQWLNEFEAEEAFHVYDHPVVFIFRKAVDYDPAQVAAILDEVPMNRIGVAGLSPAEHCPDVFLRPGGGGCDTALVDTVTMSAPEASTMPTQLQLTTERRETQYEGGTWSSLFDTSSPINAQPVLTVLAWWLAMVTLGLVVWPLLFVWFPSLTDRGYGIAKLAGLLIVSWSAWFITSVNLPLWSQAGIAAIIAFLALTSLLTIVRHQRIFAAYVRAHWRRLVGIEVVTLLAFLAFLAVRLTNPDLWHPSFGGEKPMDFAYFNGVLRSTIFPAIDPWYAGGYLNYYYFGFVLVSSPVLLLGIVPSVAYNLILPTLFALTGIAAFSVAFNIVGHLRERMRSIDGDRTVLQRVGNPWVAGIAALLLAVVFGNLDTPRVLGTGVAELGGYTQPSGLEQFLTNEYIRENGLLTAEVQFEILNRAQQDNLSDRLRYELENSTELLNSLVRGIGRVFNGETLPIATNRWFWAPTRVLSETPGVEGNAITEMPYFTFLYGDLHAHMIAMPMLLLVMVFLLNEVLSAGRDKRAAIARFFALALGALGVGLLRAVNTWDWPTFMLLGVAGLGFSWWLQWRHLNRRSAWSFLLRVGGFVALTFLVTLPFTTWYATVYGSVHLWQGGKTPLWAYFDIHGVFIFLLFSLLVWDTGRWLRRIYVRSLRGKGLLLVGLLVLVLGLLLIAALAAVADYQVALVVIPLLLWVALLFFRQGQSREMQFVLALAGLALGLTLGVEVIVIGGDIGRQNTVFKYYIEAWLLFSVVGGVAFAWLVNRADYWSGWLRNSWYGIAGLLALVALLYPVMATRAKALERMAPDMPLTLDGMDYMQYADQGENNAWFPLVDDYNMIRWLQENVEGTPVIIETQSWREYLWGGRVSIYTGLPSVLGWRFHQTQQRTMDSLIQLVNQRRANINGFYATTDMGIAWEMIRYYGIEYVIVGGLERAYFTLESLEKFETMVMQGLLEKVYEEGQSTVYRVVANTNVIQVAGVVN